MKNYKYGNNEHKILQYAEDTNVCVTDFPSIYEIFDSLKIYEAASGVKVNYLKTEGLWIGENKNLIKWTIFGSYGGMNRENEKVRFLGVDIVQNIDELNEENFHNKVQKMMQSLHFWKGKYLSRKGLPRTVNTYSLSMLFYITETQEPQNYRSIISIKKLKKLLKETKRLAWI